MKSHLATPTAPVNESIIFQQVTRIINLKTDWVRRGSENKKSYPANSTVLEITTPPIRVFENFFQNSLAPARERQVS
jgi:hypothetical protein